ncbi:MAG TPA: thermonuclease family protein [Gaiellaceae bacterium]|nr:thermonuclease family protein [Gaiellaceae bacterium]
MPDARAALAAGTAVALLAACRGDGATEVAATVSRVADGDTLVVRLADGGARERVRVLGIDTPELGDCGADEAAAATRSLALRRRVSLRGDSTQARRDRFGRLLAYVELPGGRDLGLELLRRGLARVYVYGRRPFERVADYRRAAAAGRTRAPAC